MNKTPPETHTVEIRLRVDAADVATLYSCALHNLNNTWPKGLSDDLWSRVTELLGNKGVDFDANGGWSCPELSARPDEDAAAKINTVALVVTVVVERIPWA